MKRSQRGRKSNRRSHLVWGGLMVLALILTLGLRFLSPGEDKSSGTPERKDPYADLIGTTDAYDPSKPTFYTVPCPGKKDILVLNLFVYDYIPFPAVSSSPVLGQDQKLSGDEVRYTLNWAPEEVRNEIENYLDSNGDLSEYTGLIQGVVLNPSAPDWVQKLSLKREFEGDAEAMCFSQISPKFQWVEENINLLIPQNPTSADVLMQEMSFLADTLSFVAITNDGNLEEMNELLGRKDMIVNWGMSTNDLSFLRWCEILSWTHLLATEGSIYGPGVYNIVQMSGCPQAQEIEKPGEDYLVVNPVDEAGPFPSE